MGQLFGQHVLPPAVHQPGHAGRPGHSGAKGRVPPGKAVRRHAQLPEQRAAPAWLRLHRAGADGQQPQRGAYLFILGVQKGPHLHRRARLIGKHHLVALHIGLFAGLSEGAMPQHPGAPAAEAAPGAPGALHQHPGLHLHHGALGHIGVPAHQKPVKGGQAKRRAGVAAVQQMPPSRLIQRHTAAVQGHVVQLAPGKLFGSLYDPCLFHGALLPVLLLFLSIVSGLPGLYNPRRRGFLYAHGRNVVQ